jgi:hypothetical protein
MKDKNQHILSFTSVDSFSASPWFSAQSCRKGQCCLLFSIIYLNTIWCCFGMWLFLISANGGLSRPSQRLPEKGSCSSYGCRHCDHWNNRDHIHTAKYTVQWFKRSRDIHAQWSARPVSGCRGKAITSKAGTTSGAYTGSRLLDTFTASPHITEPFLAHLIYGRSNSVVKFH